MIKGVFIAGNDSALFNAVEAEVASRVERYAFALIPNRFLKLRENPSISVSNASLEKARIPLDWNPKSAISARALAIAAENRLGHIDEAILVCSPPVISCAITDLKPIDIEVLANDHIKSWFFLAKELITLFKARERGALFLVYPETGGSGGKDNPADILGATALASFRALTAKLLAAPPSEAYTIQGFTGGETGNEAAFASFIFKQLDDTKRWANGKLHKYGKPGFFSK